MNKIGEGDFDCEESDVRRLERRTQLAVQEERIQQAILENKAAEKETNEKLNTIDRDVESGDSLETTNNQVIIETGVESLSQQIVESLLMTLSEQGEIEMCHVSRITHHVRLPEEGSQEQYSIYSLRQEGEEEEPGGGQAGVREEPRPAAHC